jgi:hypothetical protein
VHPVKFFRLANPYLQAVFWVSWFILQEVSKLIVNDMDTAGKFNPHPNLPPNPKPVDLGEGVEKSRSSPPFFAYEKWGRDGRGVNSSAVFILGHT